MTPGNHPQGVLSVALAHHLAALGFGVYPPGSATGVPIHAEDLPPEPDDAWAVYVLPGPPPVDLSGYITPVVQVVRRAGVGSRRTAPADLGRLRRELDGTAHVVWGADTEDEVELLTVDALASHPAHRGYDARDRPLWSLEFRTEYLDQQED